MFKRIFTRICDVVEEIINKIKYIFRKPSEEETFLASPTKTAVNILVEVTCIVAAFMIVTTFPFTILIIVEYIIVYRLLKALFFWMNKGGVVNEMAD